MQKGVSLDQVRLQSTEGPHAKIASPTAAILYDVPPNAWPSHALSWGLEGMSVCFACAGGAQITLYVIYYFKLIR